MSFIAVSVNVYRQRFDDFKEHLAKGPLFSKRGKHNDACVAAIYADGAYGYVAPDFANKTYDVCKYQNKQFVLVCTHPLPSEHSANLPILAEMIDQHNSFVAAHANASKETLDLLDNQIVHHEYY